MPDPNLPLTHDSTDDQIVMRCVARRDRPNTRHAIVSTAHEFAEAVAAQRVVDAMLEYRVQIAQEMRETFSAHYAAVTAERDRLRRTVDALAALNLDHTATEEYVWAKRDILRDLAAEEGRSDVSSLPPACP